MDIYRSSSRSHRLPLQALNLSGHAPMRRASRALSAHVRPSFSSTWDYKRPRPQSSGSLDTILTYSSSSASSYTEYHEKSTGGTIQHRSSRGAGRLARYKLGHFRPTRSSPSPASSTSHPYKHRSPNPSASIVRKEVDSRFFSWGNRRFSSSFSDRYYLPCDLKELQRQNLSVMLLSEVFGGPISVPIDHANPPEHILDIGSGDGFWVCLTHDYFVSLGLTPPDFTGMDILNMAGDLQQQGIDWSFVQHDLIKFPLPFEDESFDIVRLESMGTVLPDDWNWWLCFMDECFRILRRGGYLEIRDVDSVIRRIVPHKTEMEGKNNYLAQLGCFQTDMDTEFVQSENDFIKDRNAWLSSFFERNNIRGDSMQALSQVKFFCDADQAHMRRVAIPLSSTLLVEQKWKDLTAAQEAIRKTALELLIHETESLEPLFKEIYGKSDEEWTAWWNGMMQSLVHDNGCGAGECWEAGEWWVKKKEKGGRFLDLGPV